MAFKKKYIPSQEEPEIQRIWKDSGINNFQRESDRPVFSIDTPPPTVSGKLHLGHVYSYSHTDFIARYKRMCGFNVYYPMGFDDNGLPTERLVERQYGITAEEVGRPAFIAKCLEISEQVESAYEELWRRLGLSIDWRFTYRSINERSRRIAQRSFLDLLEKGLLDRKKAPAIWCPECRTSLAQADMLDIEQPAEFLTIPFKLSGENGEIQIATTRPELLAACVAIFVHPADERFNHLPGKEAIVPIFGQRVPILADAEADPQKGTGAVMCCTFGDQTDVAWWRRHDLPLLEAIDRSGRLTRLAGEFAGLSISDGRQAIKRALDSENLVYARQSIQHSLRAHERCDTPVEFMMVSQWFVRLLVHKQRLLQAGRQIQWHPEHMQARYESWVENLSWDWSISRQRYFGVPFPVWYCQDCGQVITAREEDLPVDPLEQPPPYACPSCRSRDLIADPDVMDTWATSSMSPQIAGGWLDDPERYSRVFPMHLRPQAHEIIRSWAFYTIAKSLYHFDQLPWQHVLISGWGIAGEGMGKISKSRGGDLPPPLEMIDRYSADAVRYWAASTGPGKDSVISEEKIQQGAKLVTKIWNVARFCERFLAGYQPPEDPQELSFSPADRWILARLEQLIASTTRWFDQYEYATAKSEVEAFFWRDLADNYLEIAKQRLYQQAGAGYEAARYSLYRALLVVLKLFAPFLPYISERIYLELFQEADGAPSIHQARWPQPEERFEDETALAHGEILIEIATAVRRYKSERSISLGSPLKRLQLATMDSARHDLLEQAKTDLASITRAELITVMDRPDPALVPIYQDDKMSAALEAE